MKARVRKSCVVALLGVGCYESMPSAAQTSSGTTEDSGDVLGDASGLMTSESVGPGTTGSATSVSTAAETSPGSVGSTGAVTSGGSGSLESTSDSASTTDSTSTAGEDEGGSADGDDTKDTSEAGDDDASSGDDGSSDDAETDDTDETTSDTSATATTTATEDTGDGEDTGDDETSGNDSDPAECDPDSDLPRECAETPDGDPIDYPLGRPVGSCRYGTQRCVDGSWGACQGAIAPKTEDRCDVSGNDDTCDGVANSGCDCIDGATQSCGTDEGVCEKGTQRCRNNVWGDCEGGVDPGTEACDAQMKDEDCDGRSNEGCDCIDGRTQDCGSDVGACRAGEQTCIDGQWDPDCVGEIEPKTETCDAQDNDENCNGKSDAQDGVCVCGDGWKSPNEECDEGEATPTCSDTCTSCSEPDPEVVADQQLAACIQGAQSECRETWSTKEEQSNIQSFRVSQDSKLDSIELHVANDARATSVMTVQLIDGGRNSTFVSGKTAAQLEPHIIAEADVRGQDGATRWTKFDFSGDDIELDEDHHYFVWLRLLPPYPPVEELRIRWDLWTSPEVPDPYPRGKAFFCPGGLTCDVLLDHWEYSFRVNVELPLPLCEE